MIYDCRNFKDNFIFILHGFIKSRVTDAPVNRRYDLAVIGSGPAGQKAAIQGAKLGKRVAIVDRARRVGGICIHHGAIQANRCVKRFFTLPDSIIGRPTGRDIIKI